MRIKFKINMTVYLLIFCVKVLASQEQESSSISIKECSQPTHEEIERPIYPSESIVTYNSGAVVLQYTINEKGMASNIEVLGENTGKRLIRNSEKYLKLLHFDINDGWKERCINEKFKIAYYYVINANCPAAKEGGIPAVCVTGVIMKMR